MFSGRPSDRATERPGKLCYCLPAMTSPLSRRSFLAIAGAAPFAASAALQALQTRKVPVGIELYSVRGELVKDLPGSVTAVAKMGYEVVEFYSPYFELDAGAGQGRRKLLDDLGIKCLSTHNSAQRRSRPTTSRRRSTSTRRSAARRSSSPARAKVHGPWTAGRASRRRLTAAAEKLRPLGMATGFHNHQTEWRRSTSGSAPMEVLARTPRRTSCCSSMAGRASRPARTRSPESRRTRAGSRACT